MPVLTVINIHIFSVSVEVTPTAAAVLTGATLATPPPHPATTVTTPLQRLPGGVQFPPALLAANPGLLGAQPGSLVVVASPSKVTNLYNYLFIAHVSTHLKIF